MTDPAPAAREWPPWDRDQPEELVRYVVPEEVLAHCPGLPARDDSGELDRLRRAYDAFSAAGVRHAHEPLSADPRHQLIRPPDQVLRAPGDATCLDAAVVFAGACLQVGLHPLILVLDPRAAGEPAHAVVAVWLEGSWAGRPAPEYPRQVPIVTAADQALSGEVRRELALPGAFAALDPSAGLRRPGRDPASFEEAVERGVAALLGGDERLQVGVDVGLLHHAQTAHRPPGWPWWAEGTPPLAQPYQGLEGLDLQSVRLLRAEYRAVPFQARDELDVLLDWCLDPANPATPRVAIVTGVGGAGKTRLAAELAHRLAGQGWYTGFARSIEGGDVALADWLATTVTPLLVVVDYAEARTDLVRELLRALRNRSWAPTHLVLTARAAGEWTKEVQGELVRGAHPGTPTRIDLQPSHPEPAPLYRRAFKRLAELVGAHRDAGWPLRRSELRSDWTTLDFVMLAWLAAQGHDGEPEGRTELYEAILDHERRYWRDSHKARGGDGWSERLFDEAAACLALVEPTPQRAPAVLTAVAELSSSEQARWRGQVADSLTRCLSSMDGRVGIRPDPIADHLMLRVFSSDADEVPTGEQPLVQRCVGLTNERERWSALVNLTRAASQGPQTAAMLARLLVGSVSGLWRPALTLSALVGGPLVEGLVDYADSIGTELPLAELAGGTPHGHAHLRPLALAAAERLVRDRAVGGDPVDHARLLHNLATRLSAVGRRQEALEAITEAITDFRQLAGANPAAFLPDLAASLNDQPAMLSELGRHQEALEAITEAVTIRRQLAGANPAAFLPRLAMSLNNQAAMLSGVGRRQEALEAITEAVTDYRQLAGDNPGAFLPDLAMSLHNRAAMLSEVGRRQEALEAITEAVTIRRQLAGANPGTFVPDLGKSLNNQANMLSEVGRHQEALEAITEAVTIRRQLAGANPVPFLPDLAMSLSNQANMLSELGRRQEALEAITEAVTDYRQLADANPAAFLLDLPGSLNNQANMLSEVGRRQEALEAITEAITIRRQLAAANPAAFLPDLAMSLTNQAYMLSEVGRHQEALEAITEAVTDFRQLDDANPAAFLSDLATSLNNQANILSEVGRHQEALEDITEAVTIRRQLVGANPAAFLPDLAMSLNNQANMLSEVGRPEEALEAVTEAVTDYRQLAAANPTALLPHLARSLNSQAARLSEVGRRQEALEAITEAVTDYRQLAAANPAAFLPYLAGSLSSQASRLSEVGLRQEAMEAIAEAVTDYRQLAGANPAAFLHDLAMSLNNQATMLSQLGRRQEALDAITEAVTDYRQLVGANPAAFLPHVAGSLNNQATVLSQLGRRQEALDAITEAATDYRQLAAANPDAFLPHVAGSLNNQAAMLSEVGRRQEALEAITEAVTIRRQLAGTNAAAFLPDLGGLLSNQANMLSELGRRQEALEAITEAVTDYRQLAGANPAAFLPKLAGSLSNQANMLSELGRRQEAQESWESSIEALQTQTGHQAELLSFRASWRAEHGDDAGLQADLVAITSISSRDPRQLEALGRARRAARSLTGHLAPGARQLLPAWATTAVSDETTTLASGWAQVAGTPDESAFLVEHAARLEDPDVRVGIAVLAELHPGDQHLARAQAVFAQVDAMGASAAVAAVHDANHLMRTLREWIATTTWSASRTVLDSNRDLLLSDAVIAVLAPTVAVDPTAAQHLGIIRLCRQRPIGDVYDAVIDVSEAADQIGEAIEAGSESWLQGLLMACPRLAELPFLSHAAAGVLALLAGQSEDARQLVTAAAVQGTDTQRRALAGRLKRLAARNPEHAAVVTALTPLLQV